MSTAFKAPILAGLFRATGVVIVILGLLGAITHATLDVSGDGPGGIIIALATLLISLIVALLFFGIAQVVTYISKTAFYAEAIHDALRMANCPHCGASIPVRTLRNGNNSCPECNQTFVVK